MQVSRIEYVSCLSSRVHNTWLIFLLIFSIDLDAKVGFHLCRTFTRCLLIKNRENILSNPSKDAQIHIIKKNMLTTELFTLICTLVYKEYTMAVISKKI